MEKNPNKSSTGIFPKKSRCWNSCDPKCHQPCQPVRWYSTYWGLKHPLKRPQRMAVHHCWLRQDARRMGHPGRAMSMADVLQLPTSWDFETNFARASFYGPKKPFYWFFLVRDPWEMPERVRNIVYCLSNCCGNDCSSRFIASNYDYKCCCWKKWLDN